MTISLNRRTFAKGSAFGATSALIAPHLIAAQGSAVTLKWWSVWPAGPQSELQELMVQEFNAANSDVQIELSVYPDYNQLANAAIIAMDAGEGPNIVTVSESWWFAFYLRQALHDLGPLVDTPDDYIQNLYTEYQRNGGQWAIPFARSTPLFYYNKSVLDAAGLDADVFATWSSFREAAPDMLAASKAKLAFGMYNVPDELIWTMQGPMKAWGGQISDDDFTMLIDSQENIDAATFMQEFVQSGHASPINNPPVDFGTGSSAATVLSTAYLGAMQTMSLIEFGVLPLPVEMQPGVPTGGSGLAVLRSTSDDDLEAAMKFITYATNTDSTARWSMTTGYIPVRTSAIESEAYQKFLVDSPDNAVAIDQLGVATMQDAGLSFVPSAFEAAGGAWVEILVNGADPAAAFATAKEDMETLAEPVREALEEIEG